MARIRIEVAPNKARDRTMDWKVKKNGKEYSCARTKKGAMTDAKYLKNLELVAGNTVSLRIKSQDGRFQEERTYPRSSDPRKSKG